MNAIELQIPEDMQQDLQPYRDHLRQLLELGLAEWKRKEKLVADPEREQILNVLRATDGITLPGRTSGEKPRAHWTPITVQGRPLSEIVIEQRD